MTTTPTTPTIASLPRTPKGGRKMADIVHIRVPKAMGQAVRDMAAARGCLYTDLLRHFIEQGLAQAQAGAGTCQA